VIKKLAIASIALVLGFVVSPLAQAHTVLLSSDPGAGSTVKQLPEQVTLTFAGSLLTLGSKTINAVEVVDPMGQTITSPNNVVRGNVLTNVLSPSMVMSGTYRVIFRVAAQDGHVLNGSFNFEVGTNTTNDAHIAIPKSGTVRLYAQATGHGVMDSKGAPSGNASGTFLINFSEHTLCFSVKSNLNDVSAIHIHAANQMNMTMSDEIFLPLDIATLKSAKPICRKESGSALATVSKYPSQYVLMLHTKKYPDGAVAGFLHK